MTELGNQLQATLGAAYAVERELGGGGMSRVFVATETALGRRVVVKVLPPETSGGVNAERFRREVAFAARLQHPCIVPLLSAGEAGGLLYYMMPFVTGDSLRSRLAHGGALPGGGLPVPEVVRVLRDVSSALAHAHAEGVVHRDLKPDNVLLSGGYALVTDFGVAKALSAAATSPGSVTSTNVIVGTPLYMAPEQAAGDSATDHRADIYALGVVAYELLAGAPPFRGRTPHQLFAAHIAEAPQPLDAIRPNMPAALAALVMRCLAKNPADRPQSADAVLGELDCVLASRGEAASAGAHRPAKRPDSGRPAGHRRTVLRAAAVAIVLGLLGYRAWSFASGRRTDSDAAGTAAAATGYAASAPKSVAVLPFANIGGDTATEYFADGMTEELINALTKIEGLRVPARSSVFALKGKGLDVRTVGDTLGVATVLEGSVRRAGSRLKVTAQLVSASDGYQLWSEVYDRELADIFAVQEEIARAIVGALRVRLTREGKVPLVRRATDDLDAYNLYLQGRYFWNQRTGEALEKAIGYFGQAAAMDSGFARAHAGLADAYIVLPLYANVAPRGAYQQARRAAERALALDSALAEAHATLARVKMFEWDWRGAEQGFRWAIQLDPGYAVAHMWYGDLLGQVLGRVEEGLREEYLAQRLDPLSRIIGTALGGHLYSARRYDEAISQYRRVLELDPNFATALHHLGRAYWQKGLRREAIAEFERSAALGGGAIAKGFLGYAYASMGERHRAVEILQELESGWARGYLSPLAVALIYTGLGDTDQAFVWLDRTREAHDPLLTLWVSEPLLDPLRGDARFTRLVKHMGLEP